MLKVGVQIRASEEQLRRWMVDGLDGDAKAHQALLGALAPMMRSFFGRRLRGAVDDVEDLVQETLIAIHTRRATYDRDRPFSAWAYAVARYKMIDHFRRSKSHVPFEDLEEILVAEGFQEAASAQMDVNKLLDDIAPKQAQAIRDTKIEGLSIAEAAEKAGISEADVKISVHRGLKALANRLKGN
ncbi:MAG: sigma-70 family RNA polymerase sigma factor [Sphingomonas sp.]|jgi:RNA polymerase sigma-70 factor (ECF subfamily)